MFSSLDGYTEDGHGGFGWGAPEDEELHSYINEFASSFGTYLYGRWMYETMVYWETAPAHTVRDQPQFVLEFARQWQAAEKIVYSRTLAEPRSARTRIEREFDPGAVRRLITAALCLHRVARQKLLNELRTKMLKNVLVNDKP